MKSVMAGARVTIMTSALLRDGPTHFCELEEDSGDWMEEYEHESPYQIRGSMSSRSVTEPAAFERANYMKVLSSYTLKDMGTDFPRSVSSLGSSITTLSS